MRKALFLAAIVSFGAAAACSSSSSSPDQSYTFLDSQAFCSQYITQCKGSGTFADCQANSEPLRVSQSCADGAKNARQGKHIVMTDGVRIITIPRHDPVDAHTMGGIVLDAGLSPEQFRKLV